jgi:hypothetical protein
VHVTFSASEFVKGFISRLEQSHARDIFGPRAQRSATAWLGFIKDSPWSIVPLCQLKFCCQIRSAFTAWSSRTRLRSCTTSWSAESRSANAMVEERARGRAGFRAHPAKLTYKSGPYILSSLNGIFRAVTDRIAIIPSLQCKQPRRTPHTLHVL